MTKRKYCVNVLTTPYGRYEWWEGLSIIEYIPKGQRRPAVVYPLWARDDNEARAIYVAAKKEIERYKERTK